MSDAITSTTEPGRALFGLSAAVFARRDGKILILKRAMGEATGGWYIPGGAVDPGETVEQAAHRELFEEAGLRVAGPLTLIGVEHLYVYGGQALQVSFAADCPDGEVTISHEHAGARWIDPREYLERYFSDAALAAYEAADPRAGPLARSVRNGVAAYVAWCDHERDDNVLRTMRLTADVFLVRDGRILLLERAAGRGQGFWYVPGGNVDPGEDPAVAAVRETLEETGLAIEHAELLRVWGFRDPHGWDTYHASFYAEAPAGDVTLSHEHTNYAWMTPEEYVERYCGERMDAAVPQYATFFRQARMNCRLVAERIAALASA